MTDAQNFQEPLFKSTRGALAFAFNFTHGTMKKGTLAQFIPADKVGKGLVGVDGAAQAGMIKAEVGQLPLLRRKVITSRFSPPKSQCSCRAPCCAGYRLNREWVEAIDWLSEHGVKSVLSKSDASYRLRRSLVVRYFGEPLSMIKIAEVCRVNKDTASDQNRKVVTFLADEERLAELEIQGRLEAAGIIGA